VKIDFPFSTHNEEVLMPIWLFSSTSLLRQLQSRNIKVEKQNAIYNVTNLLPSVALDRIDPPSLLIKAFDFLRKVEVMTSSLPLFRSLGCSLVLFGKKF
jgi:hypothetical protein